MGIFSSKKEEEQVVYSEPKVAASAEAAPVKPVAISRTVIGKGVTFEGSFSSNEDIVIEGSILGDITTTAKASVAKGGFHRGKIDASSVDVAGEVSSTIVCTGTTHVASTGVINGNLTTAYLDAEHGGSIEGDLRLKKFTPAPAPAPVEPAPAEEPAVNLAEEGDVPVTEEDIFG